MKKKPFIGQTKAGVWFVACFPDDGKRFQKSIGHGDKGERIAHEISDLVVQDALSLDEFYSWDAKDKDWESCIRLVKERQLQTEAEKNEFFGQTWATSTSEQVKPSQGHCSSSTPSIASISLAPSLKQAVESYIKDMSVRCVSREFIKNVLRVALKHFYPAFGEDTPIDQISYAKDIAPWINSPCPSDLVVYTKYIITIGINRSALRPIYKIIVIRHFIFYTIFMSFNFNIFYILWK